MERVTKIIDLFNHHQYDKAEMEIEKAQAEGAEHFELYLYKGKILQKRGKYGDAINMFNKAKTLDANDPRPDLEIRLINNILQITNNFYYENPYTDMEIIDNL